MANDKRLFAKPHYPTHIFGARQGEWPEIGPEWTELTPEQLKMAEAEAAHCSVVFHVLEVGSAQELLEGLQRHGELPPDAPAPAPGVVRVAPPATNATTDEWLHYARDVRGLEVYEGAKRGDIQAIVAAADASTEPQQNEEA